MVYTETYINTSIWEGILRIRSIWNGVCKDKKYMGRSVLG